MTSLVENVSNGMEKGKVKEFNVWNVSVRKIVLRETRATTTT